MHLTYRGIYNMSTCNMTGDTSGAGKFTWDLPHNLSFHLRFTTFDYSFGIFKRFYNKHEAGQEMFQEVNWGNQKP
jgi:hypothetical protein